MQLEADDRAPAGEQDDFEDDDDAEWDTWAEEEKAPTTDLFSGRVFESASECLEHAQTVYGIDLNALTASLRLDIYGRVKLVNFVRSSAASGASAADVARTLAEVDGGGLPTSWPWADDKYLVPVMPDDPLLYSLSAKSAAAASADASLSAADGGVEPMEEEVDDASASGAAGVGGAGGALAQHDPALLLATITEMRSVMQTMLGINEEGGESGGVDGGGGEDETATLATSQPGESGGASSSSAAAATPADDSARYFESYARLSIHEEMLSDKVRTLGYRDAIEANASLFAGKVVLDVGCGTAILSMLACTVGGARHVIAVDASDIVEHARRIVEANGLSDRITVLRGTMETVALPAAYPKVDVIISEWMGYALLYESMLPSVLFARDRYLAPGGHVLPTSCPLFISLGRHERLAFWDDVYGFDMSCLKSAALKEAVVEVVPPEAALSAPHEFRVVDCVACDDAALDFSAPFRLVSDADATLTCFLVHFDAIFDLARAGGARTSFTTSHLATPTHWKQTALYLAAPIALKAGDVVEGTVYFYRCSLSGGNKRGYDISASFVPPGKEAPITQMWRME